MAQYTGQEEIYEFQHILNYRSTKQVELFLSGNGDQVDPDQQLVYVGSESDDVFELYFTPMGGGVLTWDETTNAYCKYFREMYESEDYIELVWNAASYTSAFSFQQQVEMMINTSFHENTNVNNKIYMNTTTFTGDSFSDLKVGEDIGLKSFNQKEFGAIHNKDVHISYVKDGQRYYVSLMNSMNVHGGSMYYQANHMLVIKETECSENSVFFTALDRTTNGIVEHAYGEELTYPSSPEEHGYHYLLCTECGKEKQLGVIHHPGEWMDAPNGVQYRNCTICGDMTDTRSIGDDIKWLWSNELTGVSFEQSTDTLIASPTASSPYTFETLIHLPKGSNARAGVILGSYTGGKEDQINLEVYLNGKFRLYYKTGGSTVSYNFKTDVRAEKPQHIALTVDGLNAVLYLNGVQVETATLTKPLPANVTNFVIGGDHRTDNSQYFRGKVLSVNLFSDVRTAEEIQQDTKIVTENEDNLLYSAYFGDGEQIHLHTFDNLCDTDCNICGRINEEAQHIYDYDCDAECNVCGATREAADHTYDYDCDADCNVCGATREAQHSYFSDCDNVCEICGQKTRDNDHTITHVEAVEATCYENGNIEYWTCDVCGAAWLDAECTLNTNLLAVVLPMGHGNIVAVEAKEATCSETGNIAYWYCVDCGAAWLDAECTLNTNLLAVILPTAEHTYDHAYDTDCNACGAGRDLTLPITFCGNSVSEDVSGLAFLFEAEIEGIAVRQNTYNRADFTNATFDGHKLIRAGAIASNGKSDVDIAAVHMYAWSENSVSFAYRVIQIPEANYDTTITMTPYYVIELDGQEVTVYGETQSAVYNEILPQGSQF